MPTFKLETKLKYKISQNLNDDYTELIVIYNGEVKYPVLKGSLADCLALYEAIMSEKYSILYIEVEDKQSLIIDPIV